MVTNQTLATVALYSTFAWVDASGNPLTDSTFADGEVFYLDLSGVVNPSSVNISAKVPGGNSKGLIISVPKLDDPSGTPTQELHAQTLMLVAGHSSVTSAKAAFSWLGAVRKSDDETDDDSGAVSGDGTEG